MHVTKCLGSEKLGDGIDIDQDREDQVRRKYVRKSKNLRFGRTKFALLNPQRDVQLAGAYSNF